MTKEIEYLIKSKERVQKHGEVFTPAWVVKKMLDVPEIKQANNDLFSTFLEPAAGEGAFLTEILRRKLVMVAKKYNKSLAMYENFSLLALSTIYGIELLEDNLSTCHMRLYDVYLDYYRQQAEVHGGSFKQKIKDSAKTIIGANIRQGDFLKRKNNSNKPIIFSEWTALNIKNASVYIDVQRTEYTLDEIFAAIEKEPGTLVEPAFQGYGQISLFDILEMDEEEVNQQELAMIYTPVRITEVYKEEMEAKNA